MIFQTEIPKDKLYSFIGELMFEEPTFVRTKPAIMQTQYFIVAEGEVVGQFFLEKTNAYNYFHSFVILKRFQGKGYASRTIKRIKERYNGLYVKKIFTYLTVKDSNEKAYFLYSKYLTKGISEYGSTIFEF